MADILPVLADTRAAAKRIRRPEGTVRRWAHEGRISARARDLRGRKLYEITEIDQLAEQLSKFSRETSPVSRETSEIYKCQYCLTKQTLFPCPDCYPEIYIG